MSQTTNQVRNRRITMRRRLKNCIKATCRKGVLDLGSNLALTVLDVSQTGIRLVIKEKLDFNQVVAVTLEGAHRRRPLRHTAKVAWCMETADQEFCVGLCFEKRLPYAELIRMT
jgi:hypothetical protein